MLKFKLQKMLRNWLGELNLQQIKNNDAIMYSQN